MRAVAPPRWAGIATDAATPAGLRDRVLIALMIYSFARIGAAQLYDRRHDEISLDEVERILI